jgi:transposase-like protein
MKAKGSRSRSFSSGDGILVDRGLDASKGVLFVTDGGKALLKAIRATFGPKALVQRCRRHDADLRIMPTSRQDSWLMAA